MALNLRTHGGGCCGLRHIVGFYGPVAVIKEQLERLMAQVPQGRTRCRVIECVLTQEQRRKHGKTLEDAGFKIVTRFRNANTGATLNVYHFCLYPVAEQDDRL